MKTKIPIVLLVLCPVFSAKADKPPAEVLMTEANVDRWLKANPGKTRADIPKRYLNTEEINRWRKQNPDKPLSQIPGYMMPAVTVTATRTPRSPNQTGRSVSIIDRKEIRTRAEPTLTELLRAEPGVDARTSVPGQSSSIFIRGADSDQTKLMLDGIDLTDVSTPGAAPVIDALPTFHLGRVEIVRGTASSLYGSDAIGGVVNLIPARPETSGLFGGFSLGSFETRRLYGGVNYVSDSVVLTAAHQDFRTEGLSASSAGTEKDGFESQNSLFNSRFRIDNTWELGVLAYHVDSRTEFDDSTGDNLVNNTDARQSFLKIAPRAYLGPGWTSTLNLTLADQRRTTTSFGFGITSVSDFRSTAYDIDWQNDLELGRDHLLTVGLVQRKENADTDNPTFASFFDEKRTVRSVYLEDQIGLGRDAQGRSLLELTAGIRVDDYSDFGSATTYTLAARHTHHPTGTTFHGSYGTGFEAPSLFELFDGFSGNPNLQPEESRGWDAGVDQQFGPDLTAGITYIQTDIRNPLDFDTTTFTFVQGGSVYIRGCEVEAQWKVAPNLSIRPHYTFTEAENEDGSQRVRRPRHKAGLSVDAQLIERILRAQLTAQYTGWRNDIVPGSFPAATTSNRPYTLLDLVLAWRSGPNTEWRFKVSNLTDEDYEDILGFTSPGRAFEVGLDWRF
ncbi:MAG: TonB-dependent receptor [Phycisphaeraceae bacterium]|nr:TonB-dependent receptor [Phycisphaeraceae bacterium]